MSKVSFGKTVSLKQAAQIIMAAPENVFMLRGEPGIGKSSTMDVFERMYGDSMSYAYVDCGNKDLGDIAMPVVNREAKITEYFPNAVFQLQEGKPVVIMLDEFTKAPQPVQNMLHPLFETRNPRLGDIPLPKGSMVFLTGNLTTDGVGDKLKAHTRNRVCELIVRKATSEEWLGWAAHKGTIDPIVMSFVHQYPHVMASYLDDPKAAESNPYIYNPKVVQDAYASPRSLERASNVVSRRDRIDADSLIAALAGTIGEACARDMQAFVEYQDQLPSWDSIIANPDKAKVPEGAGACAVMVFGAIQKLDKQNMTPFMQYLGRFETEWQACFAVHVASNPAKQQVAFSNRAFAEWMRENTDIV
jgi:hypothetical protein